MSQIKGVWIVLVIMAALIVSGCSSEKEELALTAGQEQAIADRLAPAGEVALEGEAGTGTVAAAASSASGPRGGEEVYNTKCMACHATGAAGAPMMGNAEHWAARIGQGLDTLYKNAISGLRGMPPKGLCMDCSDKELQAAVDYMVDGSK